MRCTTKTDDREPDKILSLLNIFLAHSAGRHSVDGHTVARPHVRDVEDAKAFITEREERWWKRSRGPPHLSLCSEIHAMQVAGKNSGSKEQ